MMARRIANACNGLSTAKIHNEVCCSCGLRRRRPISASILIDGLDAKAASLVSTEEPVTVTAVGLTLVRAPAGSSRVASASD